MAGTVSTAADPGQLRRRAVAAIAQVVRDRASDERVRLAPDLVWDERLGLSFVVWFVAPAVASMPGEATIGRGLFPEDFAWIGEIGGLTDQVEIVVVPNAPGDHDRVVASVRDVLGDAVYGAFPRWVHTESGATFCPAWRIGVDRANEIGGSLEAVVGLEPVRGVRIAPGEPIGLEDEWGFVDPRWHWTGRRWFLQLRCGQRDRDRMVRVGSRALQDRDDRVRQVLAARVAAGEPIVDQPIPVVDSSGRAGLEVPLRDRLGGGHRLRRVFEVLGAIEGPCSVAYFGWLPDRPVVQLWWPDVPESPPRWR